MPPQEFFQFYDQAIKLKTTYRHTWLEDESGAERQEDVAGHSWAMCLMAISVYPHLTTPVDLLHTLKMIIVHDLAEAITKDIPAHLKMNMDAKKVEEAERKALNGLFSTLPKDMRREFMELWQEFEDKQTTESLFAHAMDKAEAVWQHNRTSLDTWNDEETGFQPYYKDEYFNWDPYIRKFKDYIDLETMRLIEAAGKLDKVPEAALRRWKSTKSQ